MSAATYMVIERFRDGNSARVYQRFERQGRMLSKGLRYIDSWLADSDDTCWQVMEADDVSDFDPWIARWQDLADFEVIPLKTKPTEG